MKIVTENQLTALIERIKQRLEVSQGGISYVGAGRPDMPDTLSVDNQAAIAQAPIGATFVSTDGAGIKAWQWVKRGNGWVCTDVDSGWHNITSLVPADLFDSTQSSRYMHVRRINNVVYYRFRFLRGGTGRVLVDLPLEYQQDSPSAAAGVLIPNDAGDPAGKMQFGTGGGLEWKPRATTPAFGVFSSTAKSLILPATWSGVSLK